MYKAYWWNEHSAGANGVRNFGDYLTDTLLTQLGIQHVWAAPDDADLVVSGSILEQLPCCWPGTVVGAGAMFWDSVLHLEHTNVLAVRGPLSAAMVDRDVALGDPGLMASLIIRPQPVTYDLGIIPHWSDTSLAERFSYGTVIDVKRGPMAVMTDIAKCRKVVSSSLHGIICADAFGIPRQAELPPFDPKGGSDFKWDDYALSVGMKGTRFGEMDQVDSTMMEARQKEIRDALATLA